MTPTQCGDVLRRTLKPLFPIFPTMMTDHSPSLPTYPVLHLEHSLGVSSNHRRRFLASLRDTRSAACLATSSEDCVLRCRVVHPGTHSRARSGPLMAKRGSACAGDHMFGFAFPSILRLPCSCPQGRSAHRRHVDHPSFVLAWPVITRSDSPPPAASPSPSQSVPLSTPR